MKQIVTIMCPYVDECGPTGEFYFITGQFGGFANIKAGLIWVNGYIGKDIQSFIF